MQLEKTVPVAAGEEELAEKMRRFLGAFAAKSSTLDALKKTWSPAENTAQAVLPFSGKRKKSAAAFADGSVLILGAPSFVLPDGHPVLAQAKEIASGGLRVLVFGEAKGAIGDRDCPAPERVLGLVALRDEIRPNCADTLDYFRKQGVSVRIISGDDPATVASIAKQVGIENADRWLDVSRLNDEELSVAAEDTCVFGRVSPAQKRLLVETLKKNGHIVAMTGDGVNDIPALKAADCSIAMPGGSDAARHTAQINLLGGDFAMLPEVVWEGRRVVGNITRASTLFLVKTVYACILSLATLLLPLEYPFQAIMLTLVSTLTIGAPSFVLALEPNRDRIRGSFLKTVLRSAVPGGACVAACALVSMALRRAGLGTEASSTLAVLAAGGVQLMVLCGVCRPFTRLRAAMVALMAAALALAVAVIPQVFYLAPSLLALREWLILAGMLAASAAVLLLCARPGRDGISMQ